MSSEKEVIVIEMPMSRARLRAYVIGFVSSIGLTVGSYLMVVYHIIAGWRLLIVVALLAVLQLLVQLVFFLHLGRETKPRWKLAVFLFMLMIIVILVFGSLWIMANLNYNMSPPQVDHYLQQQDAL